MMTQCPHCRQRVWLPADGICPSCKAQVSGQAAPVVAEVVAEPPQPTAARSAPLFAQPTQREAEVNPYEAPRADSFAPPSGVPGQARQGLWRKGRTLIIQRGAELPDRCIKSNQPAHGKRLKRRLNWHHPAIYLLVFVSPLIYIIVALIVTKKATIHIGLSEAWLTKRRRAILIGWSTVLMGVGMFVFSISLFNQPGPPGQNGDLPIALLMFGLIAFLGGAIYGLLAARMVSPSKIDDHLIWIHGACPAYLAELPEWPYRS